MCWAALFKLLYCQSQSLLACGNHDFNFFIWGRGKVSIPYFGPCGGCCQWYPLTKERQLRADCKSLTPQANDARTTYGFPAFHACGRACFLPNSTSHSVHMGIFVAVSSTLHIDIRIGLGLIAVGPTGEGRYASSHKCTAGSSSTNTGSHACL